MSERFILIIPEKLMARILGSDIVPHLHGKNATDASEYASTLFDLSVDDPNWKEDGLPFDPKVIREEFEHGNLELLQIMIIC